MLCSEKHKLHCAGYLDGNDICQHPCVIAAEKQSTPTPAPGTSAPAAVEKVVAGSCAGCADWKKHGCITCYININKLKEAFKAEGERGDK